MMDKTLIELHYSSSVVMEQGSRICGANDDTIMALIHTDANVYKGLLTTLQTIPTIVAGNFDTVASGALGNKEWVGLAYGAGKWIALASKDGNTVILTNNGVSEVDVRRGCIPHAPEEYSDLVFGNNAWAVTNG